MPSDGTNSMHVIDYTTNDFESGVISPVSYRGETGSIETVNSRFFRGDCNDDGAVDLSDPIFNLLALFVSPTHFPCTDTCDSNDDGSIDIADPVTILRTLFQSSIPLSPPAGCGVDETVDPLDCASFSACPGTS